MATLTANLTLTSTDTSSDELSLTTSKAITVGPPQVGISKIVATAIGSQSVIIPAGTAVAYLYIKHTGKLADGTTSTTRQVDVENTDNEAFARLSSEEWLFMPFNHAEANVGVQLHVQHSSSSDVVLMEYAYWTTA